MDTSQRAQFEQAKAASISHQLVRAARLVRAHSLRSLRLDTRFAFIREAHINLMPHLDLEGTRLTELAARMEVTKQAVGPVVDELVSWGYLERVPDPSDGRARLVRFTPTGLAGLQQGMLALQRLDSELGDALSQDEQGQLLALVARVLEKLES